MPWSEKSLFMDRLNKGHYFYINMSSKDRNATVMPKGNIVAFLSIELIFI